MLDRKLRAAAERLERAYLAGLPSLVPEQHFADCRDVARAYIAEHPADDGERITEDWLLSIGGEELTAGDKRRGIAVGKEPGLVLCWRWGHPKNRSWSLEHWTAGGECGWLELENEPQTRGEFRRMAAGLGIFLNTPTP